MRTFTLTATSTCTFTTTLTFTFACTDSSFAAELLGCRLQCQAQCLVHRLRVAWSPRYYPGSLTRCPFVLFFIVIQVDCEFLLLVSTVALHGRVRVHKLGDYCATGWSSSCYILRSTYTSPTTLLQTQAGWCVSVMSDVFLCFFFIILRSTYTPFTTHSLLLELRVVALKTQVRLLERSTSWLHSCWVWSSRAYSPFLFRGPRPNLRSVSNVLTFDVHVSCHGMFVLCWALFIITSGGVGRQALHTPSPAPSSATVAYTSEEEGLHADPLPHNLSGYICDVSVHFGGGGGIAPQAILLTTAVVTSEEEGLHLPPLPRIAGGYFGGGGTGPPPHSIGMFFVFPTVDGELTLGGVNTVHHTGVRTCHLSWQSSWRWVFIVGAHGAHHTGDFMNTSDTCPSLPVFAFHLGNQFRSVWGLGQI